MISTDPNLHKDPTQDITLDDDHAHILIEYDKDVISLRPLMETIETTGAKILETNQLVGEPNKGRISILFKLNIEDVKDVVLSLSKHPLISVRGYNPRMKPSLSTRSR